MQGIKLEIKNYKEWSGKPTTILLRKDSNFFDDVTKQKIYDFIYRDFEIDLMSDNSDPNISNAVKLIISDLRDNKKDKLLQIHNTEYGFARNLAGSNSLFLIQSLVLFIATSCYYLVITSYASIDPIQDNIIIPIMFLIMFLLSIFLQFHYYPTMVKNNAFRYAQTLLESYYTYSKNKRS